MAETCSTLSCDLAVILLSLSWYRFCPETSVTNYKHIPLNIPEEGRSQPHERGFTAWSLSLACILPKLCQWISLILMVVDGGWRMKKSHVFCMTVRPSWNTDSSPGVTLYGTQELGTSPCSKALRSGSASGLAKWKAGASYIGDSHGT